MQTVLLVFDIGTSGLKASLVDERLNILRNVTTTYPTHHRPNGGVEQDAADWWMSAVRAGLMLRELVPEYLKRVDAIGISGHMLGLLPMDGDGQALRPAIIRRDTRAKDVAKALEDTYGADYFYRISGNVLTPNLTLSKAVWLKENEPEAYEKTVKFLQCKDYLVYRLTGNMDSGDFSDASRAGLMNLSTRDYDYDMLDDLGLHAEKIPDDSPFLRDRRQAHRGGGLPSGAARGDPGLRRRRQRHVRERGRGCGAGRRVLHEPRHGGMDRGAVEGAVFRSPAAAGTHLYVRWPELFCLRRDALRGQMRQLGAEAL